MCLDDWIKLPEDGVFTIYKILLICVCVCVCVCVCMCVCVHLWVWIINKARVKHFYLETFEIRKLCWRFAEYITYVRK